MSAPYGPSPCAQLSCAPSTMTALTLTTDIREWRLGILSQASHVHEDRLYETGRVAVNPNHRQLTPSENGFRIEAG